MSTPYPSYACALPLPAKPTPGGPLERYIELLEDRITNSETRMEEMRQEHKEEIQELEDELEVRFCDRGIFPHGAPCSWSRAVSQEPLMGLNRQLSRWGCLLCSHISIMLATCPRCT